MKPRLRFAPSPTGNLHIGGARTALFNWALARRLGGAFLLRIEDTDRERSTPEFERAILEGMRWLGMDWDEGPDVGGDYGPYRQTERYDGYRLVAEALREGGHAYRCFCTTERLAKLREERMAAGLNPGYDGHCRDLDPAKSEARVAGGEAHVLRFRVPAGETRFADMVSGEIVFQNKEVDDWVMVRQSGDPTYNFVVVCDDRDMEITHVLRGEEHLTNTPKQVLLFRALGLEPPLYAHVPLMLGADKKKLSKRTGDTALQAYRDRGYPPEAVLNFLCLQGWSLDDKTTIFSLDDLVANFDPKDIRKGGSIFDPEKFLWMSGEYVRADSVERVAQRCAPFVVDAGLLSEEELAARSAWYHAAVAIEKERIRIYSELPERLAPLLAPDDAVPYDEKAEQNARKHGERLATLENYLAWLAPRLAQGLDVVSLRDGTKAWVAEQGLKFPQLFQPLRCALTGAAGGADLFDLMGLLGAEATLARLRKGLERLA